jgi:hypothetical protein
VIVTSLSNLKNKKKTKKKKKNFYSNLDTIYIYIRARSFDQSSFLDHLKSYLY